MASVPRIWPLILACCGPRQYLACMHAGTVVVSPAWRCRGTLPACRTSATSLLRPPPAWQSPCFRAFGGGGCAQESVVVRVGSRLLSLRIIGKYIRFPWRQTLSHSLATAYCQVSRAKGGKWKVKHSTARFVPPVYLFYRLLMCIPSVTILYHQHLK